MRFYEKQFQTFLKCPNCGGDKFTEIDPRIETSTYQVFCLKKDCKMKNPQGKELQTDILVPVKKVKKGFIELK